MRSTERGIDSSRTTWGVVVFILLAVTPAAMAEIGATLVMTEGLSLAANDTSGENTATEMGKKLISTPTPVKLGNIPPAAEIIYCSDSFVYVMDRNGENVQQITFENPRGWEHVAASYDRRYVVGNDYEGNSEPDFLSRMWLFDLEAGTEARLVPEFEKAGAGGVSFGPDGFIYFAGREDEKVPQPLVLYKIKYDGSGLMQLTGTNTSVKLNAADVAVSEDGLFVAYLHFVNEGLPGTNDPNHNEAWVVGSDGSSPHPVYTKGGVMGIGSIHDPELSADNKRVAFSRVNPDFKNFPDGPNTAHDIWVANVDETEVKRVTQPGPISIAPSWKGEWLVYLELNEKEDYRGVAIVKADGTGYKKIKAGTGIPKWIPPTIDSMAKVEDSQETNNGGSPEMNAETHQGPLTVTEDRAIRGDYLVEGDLVVKGDATLEVDYSGNPTANFTVKGNVTIEENGTLWIHGSPTTPGAVFTIASEFSKQHALHTRGKGIIRLEHLEFRTQSGEPHGSVDMDYGAADESQMILDNTVLDGKQAWMLGNFRGKSKLIANNTRHLPTEIYLDDACSIEITGPETASGCWMPMGAGVTGTIVLPDVTAPYSWEVNRKTGVNVDWSLKIDNARFGIGIQSRPGSNVTLEGHGPSKGGLCIGYFVGDGEEVLKDLKVGVQNCTIGGRLTLKNVQLAPFGWLIYVMSNKMLRIEDSVVNEVGIVGEGHVIIERCLLQLATLVAMGQGSTMDIRDSDIWNQRIETDKNGRITITNSTVHGGQFLTRSAESAIEIKGGRFLDNPAGCTEETMVDFETGQPRCNPFRVAGPSEAIGKGKFTCEGAEGSPF